MLHPKETNLFCIAVIIACDDRNGDENKVLGHTSSLSFVLGAATVGDYTCRVTVTGYKEIRSGAR